MYSTNRTLTTIQYHHTTLETHPTRKHSPVRHDDQGGTCSGGRKSRAAFRVRILRVMPEHDAALSLIDAMVLPGAVPLRINHLHAPRVCDAHMPRDGIGPANNQMDCVGPAARHLPLRLRRLRPLKPFMF